MDFLERAKFTASMGVPVIRLRPRTKEATDMGWPSLATTDLTILEKWNNETPDANCAAVAKAEIGGFFFLEIDDASLPAQIEKETGQKIPRTYRVRSRPGRGHFYWKQTPASIALGNVAQGYTKGGNFSARVDGAYVVAANSLHPISGSPYEVVSNAEIIECPDWLIEWIKTQKVDKKKAEEVTRDINNLIPHGFIHDQLVAQCGRLAHTGMPPGEPLEEALIAWAEHNCAPPLDLDHIRQVARSTDNWKRGNPLAETLFHGGVPAGTMPDVVPQQSRPAPLSVSIELEEPPKIKALPYPVFPEWVLRGTSVYEGLVKPFCDVNSRYPEFMFMPAVTIFLNYIATKVRIEMKDLIPSIFMVSIGRAGRVIKSSCVKDAMRYFEFMGCVGHGGQGSNNANGRSIVLTAGSPEGLGKELNRLNCKNGILFYDELKTLTDKAGIESSDLASKLLTMYESDKVENIVKDVKSCYSLLPGTYCISLIACTTDKKFNQYWGKLCGSDTGLTDRCFFLLQPETLKEIEPYTHVSTQEASVRTRQLIDKAVQKGVYRISDSLPLKKFLKDNQDSNRVEIRAEKFALYFAIDLDLDEIDEECIERGLALAEYELKVKKYLRSYDAVTREGGLQMETVSALRMANGTMGVRELQRVMNATRYGTTMWLQSYNGLLKAGWIRETGAGTRGSPKIVTLMRVPDEDDD